MQITVSMQPSEGRSKSGGIASVTRRRQRLGTNPTVKYTKRYTVSLSMIAYSEPRRRTKPCRRRSVAEGFFAEIGSASVRPQSSRSIARLSGRQTRRSFSSHSTASHLSRHCRRHIHPLMCLYRTNRRSQSVASARHFSPADILHSSCEYLFRLPCPLICMKHESMCHFHHQMRVGLFEEASSGSFRSLPFPPPPPALFVSTWTSSTAWPLFCSNRRCCG